MTFQSLKHHIMTIFVTLHPETGVFMSAHRFMSHVATHYGLKSGAIRMQFARKGWYSNKNMKVIKVEV